MKKILPVLLLVNLFLLAKNSAALAAASFSLSPAAQTVKVGDDLTVTVKFDTGGDAVSSVKASLTFPPSLLSVDPANGIPDKPTVVTKWNRRIYSNLSGTIELNGQTNVSGSDQTLAVIKFKTKAVGTASLAFATDSQIIGADAKDIFSLSASKGGSYTLATTVTPPPAKEKKAATTSQIPEDVGTTLPTFVLSSLAFFSLILGTTLLKNSAQRT